jgi:hypothetical protein
MPDVPNYQLVEVEPDLKELERLKKAREQRELEKREHKRELKRQEYWLNNPYYFNKKDDKVC